MTQKLPISCFIIAQDEADRIAPTIECVIEWVNEIIVIDSGSTDGTQELCKKLGATVIHNDWAGYGQQKNFGEQACKNDWLLNLDADEVLSDALVEEIKQQFNQGLPPASFYRMKFLTVYPGHKKPRLWADYHNYIRLYDRTKGQFASSSTHDTVDPQNNTVMQLKAPALHFSHRSLSHMIQKTDDYTNLQTKTLKNKSVFWLKVRLFTEFPLSFIRFYFLRRNFTGGLVGFYFAVSHAYSRFARIAKMLEKSIMEKKK